MEFTPTWVQTGELGLAFVVIILCSALIVFTVKQSARREERLMTMLIQQQQVTERQGEILQKVAEHMDTLSDRLEAIEKVIEEKLRSKSRRPSDG